MKAFFSSLIVLVLGVTAVNAQDMDPQYRPVLGSNTVLAENTDNTPPVEFTAYPNPTASLVYFNLDKTYEEVSIQVENLEGQMVATASAKRTQLVRMDFDRLPIGVYLAVVRTESHTQTVKVVKH